jgi:RHS repeat-associated protein
MTYPGGTDQVTYGYDNANRLTSVTDWNSNAIAYAYDDAGRMTTKTLPAGTGIVSAYTYDDADRLTAISHVKGGTTTIASVSYTLDNVGNRTQRVDQAGTHTYEYDDLYRLTEVTYPGPATTEYAFDAFGNRLTMTNAAGTTDYEYDDADRLTEVDEPAASPVAYTWDDNGSLTARGSDSFAWDYEERMTSATVNSVTTTFAYRGDGLRDSRTTGGTTTTFTWDIAAGLPVVIDDGNRYVYGAGLEAQVSGANTYYYLADGLGSTMAIVDDAGAAQKSYTYDVYGKPTASGGLANEFDFAGQQTDPTGLQYLRARYMDPETGVFLSREPLAVFPGWLGNPLGYAGANPARIIDPTGLALVDSDNGGAGCCTPEPKSDGGGGGIGGFIKDAASGVKDGVADASGAAIDAAGDAAGAAVDVGKGVLDSSANALKPPYTLNDLMTGVQLMDLIPIGPICIGLGAASGGTVAVICGGADFILNIGATVASVVQLMQSSCGWNDWQTYAYAGAVSVNTVSNSGPVAQTGVEGTMYAIQTALLNTAECQGSTSLSLAEKP